MIYKLYSDKDTTFEAKVNVSNASLKNSIVRLIVETNGVNLVFNGKLTGDKCVIPIKKLSGILEENTNGRAKLEIIVDDTYFRPWESDCIVEKHTKVVIDEVVNSISTKPAVRVLVEQNVPIHSKEQLCKNALCELKFIIDKVEASTKKDKIFVLNEFLKSNIDYIEFKRELIKEVFVKDNSLYKL